MLARLALWSLPFVIGLGIGIVGVQLFASGDETGPSEPAAQPPPSVDENDNADPEILNSTADVSAPGLPESELASEVRPLGRAFPENVLPDLQAPKGDAPTTISIPSLGIRAAPIEPVGLEESGELEVPGATSVGWFKFGVGIGGGSGSSVLAAHIAFNGRDGVFRDLVDMKVGDEISVDGPNGAVEYGVIEVSQYDKFELPIVDLFREDGEERLVLITCGGSFNPELRSYDDNVVAIAVPLA